jgi:hypothetical protein
MLKKMILSVVMLGVTVLLVFGAVNRTIAKTSDARGEGSNGSGHGQAIEFVDNNATQPLKKQVKQVTQYQINRNMQLNQRLQDSESSGTASGEHANNPQPQADPSNWVTYEGVAASVDEAELVVTLPDGSQVVIEGRAWAFAQEVQFFTTPGNQLRLQGFIEDGQHEEDEFKIALINDLTTGEWVVLREMNGRPSWAGNGWGGGRDK